MGVCFISSVNLPAVAPIIREGLLAVNFEGSFQFTNFSTALLKEYILSSYAS